MKFIRRQIKEPIFGMYEKMLTMQYFRCANPITAPRTTCSRTNIDDAPLYATKSGKVESASQNLPTGTKREGCKTIH
jgi:hypothetical protein